MLTIGKLSRATGITVEAIRFYEKQGLIAAPDRTSAGYRQYPEETVRRVRFIQQAKDAGFTLKEVGELLTLKQSSRDTCAQVRKRAELKLDDVERRLAELGRVHDALSSLVTRCGNNNDMGECPILDALEPDYED